MTVLSGLSYHRSQIVTSVRCEWISMRSCLSSFVYSSVTSYSTNVDVVVLTLIVVIQEVRGRQTRVIAIVWCLMSTLTHLSSVHKAEQYFFKNIQLNIKTSKAFQYVFVTIKCFSICLHSRFYLPYRLINMFNAVQYMLLIYAMLQCFMLCFNMCYNKCCSICIYSSAKPL